MMIEINLLPEELKKRKERFKKIDLSKLNLENVPILNLTAAVLGALVIIQILLFFIWIYSKASLNSLERRYKEILPRKTEADVLKKQVDIINKKVKAIDELMVKRFGWAKKLNDLSDSMTPGIWLTDLSYDEKVVERLIPVDVKALKEKGTKAQSKPMTEKLVSKYLIISGYASSMGEEGTALIGKFIKSLKENVDFYSDFGDIELGAIKRDRIEDQEVMGFKITCLFKEAI